MYVTIASVLAEKASDTVHTVNADVSVARVASMMASHGIGAVLVLALMAKQRSRHLPVVGADGALLAMVSVGDLTRAHLHTYLQQVDVMAAGVRRLLPQGRFTGVVDLTRMLFGSLRRVWRP